MTCSNCYHSTNLASNLYVVKRVLLGELHWKQHMLLLQRVISSI